ncbi:hypothetical protein HUJ05_005253 [Dendroctonus ponderosae]|nr:hypothetical protein HUJ05_005253 [Dendroctonus ponderosae]
MCFLFFFTVRNGFRRILKISWKDHVTNSEVLRRIAKEKEVVNTGKIRKLQYLGHIMRNDKFHLLRTILQGKEVLGVKAVIAESFERIHRSNLVGMGLIPLQFLDGENADTLGLTGKETYDINLPADLKPGQHIQITTNVGLSFDVVLRFDTEVDLLFYRNGGILNYMDRAPVAGVSAAGAGSICGSRKMNFMLFIVSGLRRLQIQTAGCHFLNCSSQDHRFLSLLLRTFKVVMDRAKWRSSRQRLKLAHQFWISYPPPGAGSSSSSKDKEKEKEEDKKLISKEQRQLEYDTALKEHHRSQREQWEIRQLDNDLLQQRQSERDRERELKELAEQRLLLADEHDVSDLQFM